LSEYFHFRYGVFDKLRKEICESEGGIDKFTTAYKSFGIHINEDNSVTCKEWAPGARQLYLYGDFSMLNFAVFVLVFTVMRINCFRWLGEN
jgi:1,4-alpha-glucan branching enzyme